MSTTSTPRRLRRTINQQFWLSPSLISLFVGFAFGCITCSVFMLSLKFEGPRSTPLIFRTGLSPDVIKDQKDNQQDRLIPELHTDPPSKDPSFSSKGDSSDSILDGLRIFIAIAAFDFSQLPHLEEVLDAYSDLCATGAAKIDVIIHATIPYPITLIDLLNSRFNCPSHKFTVTISIVTPDVRLHLVDLHRPLFYEKLEEYDLFIYTEDDIRVTPRTIASYLHETKVLQGKIGLAASFNYNVGIVRYEYNFPSNVLMDDKTRHATQNVTRVYWEHSSHIPAIPKIVNVVPAHPTYSLEKEYVHMNNHHQGMFLATRDLLKAWRKKCKFDVVTDRPGGHSQPSEGTQRVWMSSQQLYGGRHCNVQQVLPMNHFGSLTVLHLPNKNYRRVGHFRNRTFSQGNEQFDMGAQLLTAMGLHIEMRTLQLGTPQQPYSGIVMEDKVDRSSRWNHELKRKFSKEDYLNMVDRRMRDFTEYAARGGVLSEEDLEKVDLVDILPPLEYRQDAAAGE